jgi:hypothetical protein
VGRLLRHGTVPSLHGDRDRVTEPELHPAGVWSGRCAAPMVRQAVMGPLSSRR